MGEVALLAGATGDVPRRTAPVVVTRGVTGEVRVRAAGGGTRVVPTDSVDTVGILVVPTDVPGETGIGEVCTDPTVSVGTCVVPGAGTGEVISFGCVTPAPGRARRVMRTVSFFSGTAEVLATGVGGGMGWVLLSLIVVAG